MTHIARLNGDNRSKVEMKNINKGAMMLKEEVISTQIISFINMSNMITEQEESER